MSNASDFCTLSAVLELLEEPPGLERSWGDLPTELGLSPTDLHDLFLRWAGVDPRRFLQLISPHAARARLRAFEPLLRAGLADDRSGPPRVGGLVVTLESAPQGLPERGGDGREIRWGTHTTPFGPVLLVLAGQALSRLAFLTRGGGEAKEEGLAAVRRAWPKARLQEAPRATRDLAEAIFSTGGGAPQSGGSCPVLVTGTQFQLRVWEALLRVPPGALTSYGTLAKALGHPRGARAVGQAVASNTVAYLIPCHRVVRSTGSLGGYRWGSARKRAILGWEAARSPWGVDEQVSLVLE